MHNLKIGNHIINQEIHEFLIKKYKKALTEAVKNKEMIRTYGMSGTGKTTALIQFAKDNGFGVVVENSSDARSLREKFNYRKIYCRKSMRSITLGKTKFVVDDDCSFNKINSFRFRAVTGFISYDLSEERINRINSLLK